MARHIILLLFIRDITPQSPEGGVWAVSLSITLRQSPF